MVGDEYFLFNKNAYETAFFPKYGSPSGRKVYQPMYLCI